MKRATAVISTAVLAGLILSCAIGLFYWPRDHPQEIPSGSNAAHTSDGEAIWSVLLGRPTDHSVTLNLIPAADGQAYVEYGTAPGSYVSRTAPIPVREDEPVELLLDGLTEDTQYYYSIHLINGGAFTPEHSFHTARAEGSAFTFAVEADPHLDGQTSLDLYNRTLENILAAKPDFLIDLGDTFMSEKLPAKSHEAIEGRHVLLRQYFNIIGGDVPLFLALGNHEGECGWELKDGNNNLAVMATNIRKQYYPNPVPGPFYSGDTIEEPYVGLRENYYSFEWGDALFVALDPYWYTTTKPGQDGWAWTLGKAQYDWLAKTLATSDARYKFVFAHQLVGGDGQGRGGIEEASYFEWGGHNFDGSYGFDYMRPGWGEPIRQLLLDNNVTMFFHGHDHFYARQELDSVAYQLVPQPGHAGTEVKTAEKYGYMNGDIQGGSGFLKINISENGVTVEFIRPDGTVASSYQI